MNNTLILFTEKWKAILALFCVVALSFLDKMIPPLGIPLALLCIFFLNRWKNVPIRLLGLFRPQSWTKTILIGVGVAIFIQLFEMYLLTPLTAWLGVTKDTAEFYASMEGNTNLLIILLVVSWTTAGLGEELIYRGFFLGVFASLVPNLRHRWIIGLVVSSVIFGFGHFDNGVYAILATTINGFILGLVYLATNRNIWAAYLAHALTNTIELLVIYSGLYKHLF